MVDQQHPTDLISGKITGDTRNVTDIHGQPENPPTNVFSALSGSPEKGNRNVERNVEGPSCEKMSDSVSC
jgi:hypothetical protein